MPMNVSESDREVAVEGGGVGGVEEEEGGKWVEGVVAALKDCE